MNKKLTVQEFREIDKKITLLSSLNKTLTASEEFLLAANIVEYEVSTAISELFAAIDYNTGELFQRTNFESKFVDIVHNAVQQSISIARAKIDLEEQINKQRTELSEFVDLESIG